MMQINNNKLAMSDMVDIRDIRETYDRMRLDSITFETASNGSINEFYDQSYEHLIFTLIKIEEFVLKIISTNEPAFKTNVDKLGGLRIIPMPLAKYFKSLSSFFSAYSFDYKYSAHVQLFFDCWMTLELGKEVFTTARGYSSRFGIKQYDLVNDLVALIRSESRTPLFKIKLSRRKELSIRNYSGAVKYIDALLNHRCTRLLVLRLDLTYLSQYAHAITAEQATEDLHHFFNNSRSNRRLFSDFVGYIRKLEWGPSKGLHFHLILFYNGSKRCRDIYLAKELGENWKKITNGRGNYWNCNSNKDKYKRLGIGMLDIHDVEKLKILREDVVRYLAKSDQYLRAVKLGNGKAFVKGVMPKERTSNVGRPRSDLMLNGEEGIDENHLSTL